MPLSGRSQSCAPTTRGGVTTGGSEHLGDVSAPTLGFGITRTGGTVVVTFRGEIGFGDWSRIDTILGDLIDAQGNLDVVLDLCEVVSLEGDAVPLIVHAARQAHSHGGRLRLADRACRGRWRGSLR